MNTPIRRIAALVIGTAILSLAACGHSAPVTPPVAFPVFDLPSVAHPPTPDPPVDPAVAEPGVLLSPIFLSGIDVIAVGAGRVEFAIFGSVPTPCHSVKASVWRDSGAGMLDMALWSEAPGDLMCSQVLTSIAHVIAMDGLEAGTYVVRLDGIEISEVTLTGALST